MRHLDPVRTEFLVIGGGAAGMSGEGLAGVGAAPGSVTAGRFIGTSGFAPVMSA